MRASRLLPAGLVGCVLWVILSVPAVAQTPTRNHLHDKFQLFGSLSAVSFTTKIRVDSDEGPGTEVDVEDDLGASGTVAQPRFGLRWNISRRNSLEFGYLFARRDGERQAEREFVYNGETYDAGLLVKTKFDSDLATLTWRYSFHSSEKSRIGATLGLGAILFRTGLDGYLSVDDQTAEVSTGRDLTAPVGGLGGFGHWQLSPKWYLEVDLRAIYVPIDRFEAVVADLTSVVRWFPTTHLGIEGGLGFNSVRLDINEDPEAIATGDFSGQIRYRLLHPRIGLIWAF